LRERHAIAEPTSEMEAASDEQERKLDRMLMMRILGPVITFVNKPWKVSEFVFVHNVLKLLVPTQMYPVGVLFGLGESNAAHFCRMLTVSWFDLFRI
jgi:high-affinity nickel-transport protein